MKIVDLNHI